MVRAFAAALLLLCLPANADWYAARVIWSPAEVRPDFSMLPSTDIVSTTLTCGAKAGEPEQRITVLGAEAETRVRYEREQWCALEGVVLTYACDYDDAGQPINCGNRPVSTMQSQAFVLPAAPTACAWMHSMPVPWGYPHPVLTRLCVERTHAPFTEAQVATLRPLVAGMTAEQAADALNAATATMVWDDAAPVARITGPGFPWARMIDISLQRRAPWDALMARTTIDAREPEIQSAMRAVWGPVPAVRDLVLARLQRPATVAEAALNAPGTAPLTLAWSGVIALDEAADLIR